MGCCRISRAGGPPGLRRGLSYPIPSSGPGKQTRCTMELDYQLKPSASQRLKRINWRLVGFIGVFALIFGSFFYVFASSVVTGGITRHSGYAEVDLKSMGQFPFDDVNGKLTDIPKLY